jgi:hypothetical protein
LWRAINLCIEPPARRQAVLTNGSRRRKEADLGAKNTSASLPRRLRLLQRFLNLPWLSWQVQINRWATCFARISQLLCIAFEDHVFLSGCDSARTKAEWLGMANAMKMLGDRSDFRGGGHGGET